jgi:hypothetical protein
LETNKPKPFVGFEAPDLAPVIACEHTRTGWRGLTGDGEILNVTAPINGVPAVIPKSLAISRGGEVIGYRAVPEETSAGTIDAYQQHLAASNVWTRINEQARALAEIDLALKHAPTFLARYNRSMFLLALGRWQEGFEEFNYCEQNSPLFMRPQYRAAIDAGLAPWQGEDIAGKKLLLIHDHGFGDSIMMLRYVPQLEAMGADVVLQMPPELERLAAQCAPVTRELVDADYVCSIFMLMRVLRSLNPAPHLKVDEDLRQKWRQQGWMGDKHKRIGLAWSVGRTYEDDYPRALPLGLLVKTLATEGDLVSVQQQGAAEADLLGVVHFQFEDFADCAALMSLMDEIVTVDTAAVHLAGAIGHPCISLLLSYWHSWRWRVSWYENVTFLCQPASGDWEGALATRK